MARQDWRLSLLLCIGVVGIVINAFLYFLENVGLFSMLIWISLVILILIRKQKVFYELILIMLFCNLMTNNANNIFITTYIIMILQLSENKKEVSHVIILILCLTIIQYSLNNKNIIYSLSILMQIGFAYFCYFGFIYIKPLQNTEKHKTMINLTVKEKLVMDAIIRVGKKDITNEKLAESIDIPYKTFITIRNTAMKKNNYYSMDAFIADYAMQEFQIEQDLIKKENIPEPPIKLTGIPFHNKINF